LGKRGERVVGGEYGDLYLVEVHTDSVERYDTDDTFQVEVGAGRERELSLYEMRNQGPSDYL